MAKKKTQIDYWNEGVKFANEKKYEQAIEKYEKAVSVTPNPALYTNLASCYEHLGNLDKVRENYLLAIPGLLNKEYTYTSGPANSTAWWLFENNLQLETAEKIAFIAIGIDKNSSASLDTYVNILLKLGKTEKGIKNLLKLRKTFPEHKESLPLLEEYSLEIFEYERELGRKERAKKDTKHFNQRMKEIDDKLSNFDDFSLIEIIDNRMKKIDAAFKKLK